VQPSEDRPSADLPDVLIFENPVKPLKNISLFQKEGRVYGPPIPRSS
jgi:hypothetical protein